MTKKPIPAEELAGWRHVLSVLETQLVMEERVARSDRRNQFARGALAATIIARDAVLKRVRAAQEAEHGLD